MPLKNEIQIWIIPACINISNEELNKFLMHSVFHDVISNDENQAIQKFIKNNDKNRKLNTFLSRKIILGMTLNEVPSSLNFEKDTYGKPFLPKFPDIHFNISHSEAYIILALAKIPIGIDIEFLREPFRFKKMLNSTFQISEIANILTNKTPNKKFFELWTRKEAFVKALGFGLYISPKRIKVDGEFNSIYLDELEINNRAWVCNSGQIIPSYMCSLVYQNSIKMKISIHHWTEICEFTS